MKRYEAYKDSGIEWIGEIPSHWDTLPFFAIFHEECRINGDLTRTNALKFSAGTIVPKPDIWDLDEVGSTYSKYKVVDPDTIIINNLNLNFDLKSQRVGLVRVPGIITSAYIAIVPNDCINPRYAEYLLKSWDYKKAFHNMGKGLRLTLDWNELKHRKLILPSKREQISIADYLDKITRQIDLLIEETKRSIELLEEYRKSVISEAVTKGLDPNVPMKDSGIEWIGEIPEHWSLDNLGLHSCMVTPMRDRPAELDGPIPWVRIEDYEGKYLSKSKEGLGVSEQTIAEMNLKVYPAGTVLCTSSCDLGKAAIISKPLVSNQRFIGIVPNECVSSDYLYYLMIANAERLNYLSTGTIQANLSRKAFEHLRLPFPSLIEQQEIADWLDSLVGLIDCQIAVKERLRALLGEYRKSLISEAVTGKFRVPGVEQ